MKRMTKGLAAVAAVMAASCAMEQETAGLGDPLDTPGDGRFIDYVNTDIHFRLFARDYGHRVPEEIPVGEEVK